MPNNGFVFSDFLSCHSVRGRRVGLVDRPDALDQSTTNSRPCLPSCLDALRSRPIPYPLSSLICRLLSAGSEILRRSVVGVGAGTPGGGPGLSLFRNVDNLPRTPLFNLWQFSWPAGWIIYNVPAAEAIKHPQRQLQASSLVFKKNCETFKRRLVCNDGGGGGGSVSHRWETPECPRATRG